MGEINLDTLYKAAEILGSSTPRGFPLHCPCGTSFFSLFAALSCSKAATKSVAAALEKLCEGIPAKCHSLFSQLSGFVSHTHRLDDIDPLSQSIREGTTIPAAGDRNHRHPAFPYRGCWTSCPDEVSVAAVAAAKPSVRNTRGWTCRWPSLPHIRRKLDKGLPAGVARSTVTMLGSELALRPRSAYTLHAPAPLALPLSEPAHQQHHSQEPLAVSCSHLLDHRRRCRHRESPKSGDHGSHRSRRDGHRHWDCSGHRGSHHQKSLSNRAL